jgi:hypothetical protein
MKLREVHLLDEAVDDLDQGSAFYNAQEIGVGDYFIESVLGDIAGQDGSYLAELLIEKGYDAHGAIRQASGL